MVAERVSQEDHGTSSGDIFIQSIQGVMRYLNMDQRGELTNRQPPKVNAPHLVHTYSKHRLPNPDSWPHADPAGVTRSLGSQQLPSASPSDRTPGFRRCTQTRSGLACQKKITVSPRLFHSHTQRERERPTATAEETFPALFEIQQTDRDTKTTCRRIQRHPHDSMSYSVI